MSTFRNAKKIIMSKREKLDFLPSKVPFLDKTVVPEPGNGFGSDDVLLLGGSTDLLTDGFLLIYSEVRYFS